MATGVGSRFSARARELRARGAEALAELPAPEQLADRPEVDRHHLLEELRVELYAIASILADETVQRARAQRSSYPPYGLMSSGHSDLKLLRATPEPVGERAVDSFYVLGKAYVDTLVFHLDRHFREQKESGQDWMLRRLEELLGLFRTAADPATQSRLRHGFSFVYGGLHFGAGVCVQLTEVMARLLQGYAGTSAADKAAVIARSTRPAHRLAGLNFQQVVPAFQCLQAPPTGAAPQTWMRAEKFAVDVRNERPWRIDLREDALVTENGAEQRVEELPTTYATLGCPARSSAFGGPSAITTLWAWCADLAHDTGLLDRAAAPAGGQQGLPEGSSPGTG